MKPGGSTRRTDVNQNERLLGGHHQASMAGSSSTRTRTRTPACGTTELTRGPNINLHIYPCAGDTDDQARGQDTEGVANVIAIWRRCI